MPTGGMREQLSIARVQTHHSLYAVWSRKGWMDGDVAARLPFHTANLIKVEPVLGVTTARIRESQMSKQR